MWDPPSCEGLLYSCCIGVVNLTFSNNPRGTGWTAVCLLCIGSVAFLFLKLIWQISAGKNNKGCFLGSRVGYVVNDNTMDQTDLRR
jgi:hypothetical protein